MDASAVTSIVRAVEADQLPCMVQLATLQDASLLLVPEPPHQPSPFAQLRRHIYHALPPEALARRVKQLRRAHAGEVRAIRTRAMEMSQLVDAWLAQAANIS
jgi:pyruvate-formate lyase-activating enzyme